MEPGRYRLVAARACPWANRTVIVRRLLGLEDVISLGQPGPTHDARSWTFDLDPGGMDPVFAALDANHDNEIDSGELDRAPSALKTLDKNQDGVLSRDEIRPNFPGRGMPGGRQ